MKIDLIMAASPVPLTDITFTEKVERLCMDITPMTQVLLHKLVAVEHDIEYSQSCRATTTVSYSEDELKALWLIQKYKTQLYFKGFTD